MIATVLGIALIASVASADVLVTEEWSSAVSCPDNYCPDGSTFNLKSETGDPIRVFCDTFQTKGFCVSNNVTFNDGISTTTHCGQVMFRPIQYLYNAKSPEVTIHVNEGATLSCSAKTIHPPRNVKELTLSPGGKTRKIVAPVGPNTGYDGAWKIKAAEGSQILLSCDVELSPTFDRICDREVLTVDAGEGAKEYCGYNKKFSWTGSEVYMRLEAYPGWKGDGVKCRAKAVGA